MENNSRKSSKTTTFQVILPDLVIVRPGARGPFFDVRFVGFLVPEMISEGRASARLGHAEACPSFRASDLSSASRRILRRHVVDD
jgi:hypothetical protein